MSVSKRRSEKRHKSFVMLSRKMLRDKNWKDLSSAAKLFYIYLKGKFNGHNNGKIRLSYTELKGVRGISSPATISSASKELQKSGWIKRKKIGGLYRHVNEYELTGKYDDCF